ncbi:putative toxin-antitoxin system toxin component, PIN family [Planctomycetota bacterium]
MIDTNVFVSGVFFAGPPHKILQAWKEERIGFVVSLPILAEYRDVALRLAKRYPPVDILPFIDLVMVNADIVQADSLSVQVCEDPDDDMFLACALAGGVQTIVSGDKHLLKLNGYHDLAILTPKAFMDLYLAD